MVMVSERPGPKSVQPLAALDLFAGADRELLTAVAERSVEIEVPKGQELLTAGTVAREFAVILDGHAAVSIGGVPISYLGTGSCFGEMSLIDGQLRTADVVALAPMRLVVISGEDFRMLLARSPEFCGRMLTLVVGRLRLANAALAERAEVGSGSPSPETASARSVSRDPVDAGPTRARTRGGGTDGSDR
jgi:CRP-like cAMP-binding protein